MPDRRVSDPEDVGTRAPIRRESRGGADDRRDGQFGAAGRRAYFRARHPPRSPAGLALAAALGVVLGAARRYDVRQQAVQILAMAEHRDQRSRKRVERIGDGLFEAT